MKLLRLRLVALSLGYCPVEQHVAERGTTFAVKCCKEPTLLPICYRTAVQRTRIKELATDVIHRGTDCYLALLIGAKTISHPGWSDHSVCIILTLVISVELLLT